MSSNDISRAYMDISIPNIEDKTLEPVVVWEATTPETLPEGPLNFGILKPTVDRPFGKEFTDTEKACWYSHFLLWQHIVDKNEPAYIFEHDVVLDNTNVLPDIWYYHIVHLAYPGSMEAYFITPYGASRYIEAAKKNPLRDQTDTWANNLLTGSPQMKRISYSPEWKISQSLKFGTTIDHNGTQVSPEVEVPEHLKNLKLRH